MAAERETLAAVERRIIVTKHAVERARSRYGLPNLREADVRRDVEDAIAAGREALRLPREIAGKQSRRSRLHDARYVWTEDMTRAYTVKRTRDERNGHEPALAVVTAIQGAR